MHVVLFILYVFSVVNACVYGSVYLQTHKPAGVAHPHHPYHFGRLPAYSSYNPVSRQDSELQSLSSDARTESDMSLTDSSV